MKKLVALFLMLALMLGLSAMAEDLGVQVIGENKMDVVATLDDLQLNQAVEVDGICEITVTNFKYQNEFYEMIKGYDHSQFGGTFWYTENKDGWESKTNSYHNVEQTDYNGKTVYWSDKQLKKNDSKTQAEFAMLYIDILNTGVAPQNFTEKVTVKIVYDDTNEFAGWVRQFDYDVDTVRTRNSADNFPIDPYYIGHYVFGCTLPNTVIEREAPMRMEITIGNIEMTYHIRK